MNRPGSGAPLLVVATGNRHKLEEIAPLLARAPVRLVAVTSLVPAWRVEETADDLLGNARLKARHGAATTGLPAVGDDTGLFVDALDGAPGVRSSRYAGEGAAYADNVDKLLAALAKVPQIRRGAEFRTAVVLAHPDGREEQFQGVSRGRILDRSRGQGGFGYDPVFLPDGHPSTLAELPLEAKNRISHRAAGFRKLARFLAENPGWLTVGEGFDRSLGKADTQASRGSSGRSAVR